MVFDLLGVLDGNLVRQRGSRRWSRPAITGWRSLLTRASAKGSPGRNSRYLWRSSHCNLPPARIGENLARRPPGRTRHDRPRVLHAWTTMTARHRQPLARLRAAPQVTSARTRASPEEGRIVFVPVWMFIAIPVAPSVRPGGRAWRRPWWRHGQVTRGRLAALTGQPFGPDLFARHPASSLGRVSTYASSLFLVLRANSFRRGSR